jgi:hypothetical protein
MVWVVHLRRLEREPLAERGRRCPEVGDPQRLEVDLPAVEVQRELVLDPPLGRGQQVDPVVGPGRDLDVLTLAADVVGAAVSDLREVELDPADLDRSGRRQMLRAERVPPDVEASVRQVVGRGRADVVEDGT